MELNQGYLEVIKLPTVLTARVREIYNFFSTVFSEDIERVFVTNYFTQEGKEEFESLWLFSNSYISEAKQFAIKDDYDMAFVKESIAYWEMNKENFDFNEATEKSRLHIRAALANNVNVSVELKASGHNCNYLRQVFESHILTNLQKKP